MALARASYGGGGYQTDVSGMSAGYGGGAGNPDMSMMMELAKRRAAQQLEAGRLQNVALKKAVNAPAPRETLTPLQRANRAGAENAAGIDAAGAASAQARAVSGRMPTRTSFGLGYIAPNQMDTSKMTGAQRAVFLPQGSSFTGPALSDQDAARRQTGLEDMGRMQAEGRGLTDRGGNPTAYGMQQAAEGQQPGIGEQARAMQIRRQYPGAFQAMFGQQQRRG